MVNFLDLFGGKKEPLNVPVASELAKEVTVAEKNEKAVEKQIALISKKILATKTLGICKIPKPLPGTVTYFMKKGYKFSTKPVTDYDGFAVNEKHYIEWC